MANLLLNYFVVVLLIVNDEHLLAYFSILIYRIC